MIIYVKDLLRYMDIAAKTESCKTYDWWNNRREKTFNDAFIEWAESNVYNKKEANQVFMLYRKRFLKSTVRLILEQFSKDMVKQ